MPNGPTGTDVNKPIRIPTRTILTKLSKKKLILYLFNKRHYFKFFIGTKPMNILIMHKPSQLFFSVATCILLYHIDGELTCPHTVKIIKQLLISNRIQSIQRFVLVQLARLLLQTC